MTDVLSARKPGTSPPVPDDTTGPVPFADPAHPLKLRWPFGELADALLAFDGAKKREWSAIVAGDADARDRAALDKLEAMGRRQRVRDDVLHLLTFALRVALEDDTAGTVRAKLRELLGLDELEARVSELEDAVLALERRKGAA